MHAGKRRKFLPALGVGCPDVLGVVRGRFFAIEVKRDDASLERASQKIWMAVARANGIECATVRSVDEAMAIVARVRAAA